jgi:hypothetical protein
VSEEAPQQKQQQQPGQQQQQEEQEQQARPKPRRQADSTDAVASFLTRWGAGLRTRSLWETDAACAEGLVALVGLGGLQHGATCVEG